jgi:hypothetical protein
MKLPANVIKPGVIGVALIFSFAVVAADRSAGPFIRMPVLFAIPVMAVSWYVGIIAGEILAVGLPLLRLLIEWNMQRPWEINDSIINTSIVAGTLSLISFLVFIVNRQRKRIKILRGFLAICSFCKKIRTGENKWEQLEAYITRHSEAIFSHGICPECCEREYGFLIGGKKGDGRSKRSETASL